MAQCGSTKPRAELEQLVKGRSAFVPAAVVDADDFCPSPPASDSQLPARPISKALVTMQSTAASGFFAPPPSPKAPPMSGRLAQARSSHHCCRLAVAAETVGVVVKTMTR